MWLQCLRLRLLKSNTSTFRHDRNVRPRADIETNAAGQRPRRYRFEGTDFRDIQSVKDVLVAHLAAIDKTQLNMMDLKLYTEVVQMVDCLYKPNEKEAWQMLMENFAAVGNKDYYHPVTMKED